MRILLFALMSLVSVASFAEVERIQYKGSPISIGLEVNKETEIIFEESVQVGVPGNLLNLLEANSVSNRVFLKPVTEITAQKILIKGLDTGTTFVVNIAASEDNESSFRQVYVYLPKQNAAIKDSSWNSSSEKVNINSYPFLTRYVMQQLYAPDRLVKQHTQIQLIRLKAEPQQLFNCSRTSNACRAIKATPLAGFKTDRLYATAFKLENMSEIAQEIDPRQIKVSSGLLTASSMHGRLLPKGFGSKSETTIVLIHDRPISKMMRGASE